MNDTDTTTISWVLDSVEVPTAVLADPRLEMEAKLVYVAMASLADADGVYESDDDYQELIARANSISWAVEAAVHRLQGSN